MSADWSDGHGLRLPAEDFTSAAAAVSAYGEHIAGDADHIADDVLRVAGPKLVAAELRRLAGEPLLWLTSGYRADVRAWLNGRADRLDLNGDAR